MGYSPRWGNSELIRKGSKAKEKGDKEGQRENSRGREQGVWRETSGGQWSGLAPRALQSWFSQQQTGSLTGFLHDGAIELLGIAEPTFMVNLKNSV